MRTLLLIGCGLALASLSAAAAAVEAGSGFMRADVGRSQVNVEIEGLGSDDDDDRTLSLGGGYYFTPNFAAEGFYSKLYDYSEEGYAAKLTGMGFGLAARKNFGADNNGLYLSGRLGMFRASGDASAADLGSISGKSTKPYFGVGAGYDFNANFGAGVNYTRYRSDFDGLSVDARTLTVNLEVRF